MTNSVTCIISRNTFRLVLWHISIFYAIYMSSCFLQNSATIRSKSVTFSWEKSSQFLNVGLFFVISWLSCNCASVIRANIRLNFATRENRHFRSPHQASSRRGSSVSSRERNRLVFSALMKSTDFYVPRLLFVPSNTMAVGGGIKRARAKIKILGMLYEERINKRPRLRPLKSRASFRKFPPVHRLRRRSFPRKDERREARQTEGFFIFRASRVPRRKGADS